MNPSIMAGGFVHTVPEKLYEYFARPLTNITVIFILILMCANTYMFKRLWKIRAKDYMIIINLATLGLYTFMSVISAVLVSRLGPHGSLKGDYCDFNYMAFPIISFYIVAAVNVIYFVVNLFIKLKKDKEEQDAIKRGYFAETDEDDKKSDESETKHENKVNSSINFDISSFAQNIKDKIDLGGVKDKVNEISDSVKDLINKKSNED